MSSGSTALPPQASIADRLKSLFFFPHAFWMLNIMEAFERLAYYGVRVVVAIYIMQADEPGGLHLSSMEKGQIFFWWAIFQSVLPTFTGGFADRYGYKLTIFISITTKVAGYLLMATQRSYWGFLMGTIVLATGTAIFKPGIQGSVGQILKKENSSTGWGVFYWLVNVGAAIGPPFAGWLRGMGWDLVFYGCACIVSLNYLMLFTYKDIKAPMIEALSFGKVFIITIKNLFEKRLLTFLLLMSGFWLMMFQLWDLHPNFIADWIDSSQFVKEWHIPASWIQETSRGQQMTQEHMLNLNAVLIILFMIPIAASVSKLRTLTCMMIGMVMAIFGVLIAGVTMSVYMFFLGVIFFSLGEMLTGPKKSEYLSLISPPEKKALYLGYVNIPVGIGQSVGNLMSGYFYGHYGEKANLALKYLAEHTNFKAEKNWNGDISSLEKYLGVTRTESMDVLQKTVHQDAVQVTQLLWDTYHPYTVWYPFVAIGLAATIGLIIYGHKAKKWSDLNA